MGKHNEQQPVWYWHESARCWKDYPEQDQASIDAFNATAENEQYGGNCPVCGGALFVDEEYMLSTYGAACEHMPVSQWAVYCEDQDNCGWVGSGADVSASMRDDSDLLIERGDDD